MADVNAVGLDNTAPMRKHLRMAVRIATNLSLPRDLVEELDAVAGKRNRSAFVEEAIRYRLNREKLKGTWERAAGAWKTSDYPEFATSEKVVEWVRAGRA
jgi:metal-responsive CopG/Arc/MetJ family transcriptional regulator